MGSQDPDLEELFDTRFSEEGVVFVDDKRIKLDNVDKQIKSSRVKSTIEVQIMDVDEDSSRSERDFRDYTYTVESDGRYKCEDVLTTVTDIKARMVIDSALEEVGFEVKDSIFDMLSFWEEAVR